MNILRILLEVFAVLWLLTIVTIGVFGGRILIKVRNPFTKNMDTITDITFDGKTDK